jgi:hypothetical protein
LARDAGVITEDAESELVDHAKTLFYPDRAWASVFHAARRRRATGEDRVDFVRKHHPDAKRDGALAMLRGLLTPRPPPKTLPFQPTAFWDRMVTAESPRRGLLERPPGCAGTPACSDGVAPVTKSHLEPRDR